MKIFCLFFAAAIELLKNCKRLQKKAFLTVGLTKTNFQIKFSVEFLLTKLNNTRQNYRQIVV